MTRLRSIRLFQITLGQYVFSPGLIASLVTFPLLYLMFSLGQWQLSRAEYKENLQQKIVERIEIPAVNMLDLPVSDDERIYRNVKLTGSFDQQHSFLLDNQVVNGKVGYDVYTPYDAGNGQVMLVNRGFVELGSTRKRLPEIDTPAGKVTITGLMDKLPPKTLVLADNVNPGGQWPVVLQYIDMKELEAMLGYSLPGMIVRMDAEQQGVYKYHLPVLNLHSEKNRGYAFQWFAMTLALAIIYLAVNTKKWSKIDE
jgi:surfeit locus 1 family protein